MKRLVLVTLLLISAVTTHAQLATVTVTNAPGQVVPANFGGITVDFFDSQFYIPNPLYPQLIKNLVFSKQSFDLNVEGDSNSPPNNPPTVGQIATFNNLYTSLQSGAPQNGGVNLRFTLPVTMCATATPTTYATPAVTAYIANAGPGWGGVTVGNEPDGSCNGSGGYAGGYSGFKTNFDAFRTAITSLTGGSGLKFVGPSFGGQQPWVYTSSNLNSFVTNEAPNLAYASQHLYPQNGCTGSPTLAAELLEAQAKPSDFTLSGGIWNYAANAHAVGTTLRLSEFNDIDCGGRSGISNTFAAALWLMDTSFNLASVGADGINVFSDEGDQYDLMGFPSLAACTVNVTGGCFVRPNYYGFMVFQEMTQRNARILPTSISTSSNVVAWATIDDTKVIRVLVINKDQSGTGTVNVTVPGYGVGQLKTLTCAGGVTCTTGVHYAGQTFDSSTTGLITGTYSVTLLTPASNVYTIPTVAVTSAAVLTLIPSVQNNAAPGWVKIPGTAVCGGPENASLAVPSNFPANLGAYAPYGAQIGVSECPSLWNDSNGGIVDTSRNRAVFLGGGHDASYDNTLLGFEVNNIGTSLPVMVRYTNPANPYNPNSPPPPYAASTNYESEAACVYVAGCTPTHITPSARHTYNNMAYVPSTDTMVMIGGAVINNGGSTNLTWSLAMSSINYSCAQAPAPLLASVASCDQLWTNMNPSNAPTAAAQVNQTGYDLNNGVIWALIYGNGGDAVTLNNYNPKTNAWFTNSTNVGSTVQYHNMSVIDPWHGYMVSIGPDGIYYFSIANPAATGMTMTVPTTSGCSGITTTANQYPGLAWDPLDRRVVIYPNGYVNGNPAGNVLYLLDPGTWTCTTETYGITQGVDYPQLTPDVTLSGTYGTFGHFAYLPKNDIFILCNDWANDCWYLRRRRGGEKLR
jgi:hypothetical protein